MPELHPYQLRMATFIVEHPGAMIWAEVGLGKSAAALTALRTLKPSGVLIVAPKRVAEHVWLAERALWAPQMPMEVVRGTQAQRMRLAASACPVKVISRDNLKWLVDNFKDKWRWPVLVLDESQSFKDPSTQRFKALKKILPFVERVVELSATPASENLLGLWSQAYLVDRGMRLGRTYTAYKDAFFTVGYDGFSQHLRTGAEAKIYDRVADIAVSLLVDDYLTLPDKILNRVGVYMSDDEQAVYDELEREALLQIANGESIVAVNAAVLWGKLHQLASGAVYDEGRGVHVFSDAKIDALREIVDGTNDNVLVFYAYRHEAERIRAAVGAEELDVERWCAGKQRVAIAHPDSAGAGLNLQSGGHTIVWFAIPASNGLYTQANGRLHRQGQQHPVVVHHLIAAGTSDEVVMATLGRKQMTQLELLRCVAMKKAPEGAPEIRPEDF